MIRAPLPPYPRAGRRLGHRSGARIFRKPYDRLTVKSPGKTPCEGASGASGGPMRPYRPAADPRRHEKPEEPENLQEPVRPAPRRGRLRAPPARRPPVAEAVEPRVLFATFVVTNVNDSGAGSLRQAILSA